MTHAFDSKIRRRFVLPRDRSLPEDEQPFFVLRILDIFDRTKIADLRASGMAPAAVGLEILRMSLDGWGKYKFKDGREAPFERGPNSLASDDTLRCLSDQDAADLLAETVREEEVTPKQAGE